MKDKTLGQRLDALTEEVRNLGRRLAGTQKPKGARVSLNMYRYPDGTYHVGWSHGGEKVWVIVPGDNMRQGAWDKDPVKVCSFDVYAEDKYS